MTSREAGVGNYSLPIVALEKREFELRAQLCVLVQKAVASRHIPGAGDDGSVSEVARELSLAGGMIAIIYGSGLGY